MYKDKRGLYREMVVINGKRKYFSGKTKKDVALKMMAYNIEQKEQQTLRGVAELWQESNWDRLRFGSLRTYAPCLKRILDRFGDRDISSIKTIEVQTWLKELGDQYAQKTVSNHKSLLSQICDFGIVNLGIEMQNPCDRAKLPSGLRKGTREALSNRERTAILSTTKDDFQLGYLILYTGCRLGEALALQMRDIDMKQNVIRITKSVAFHGNQPQIQSPKTKNSVRTVPLLPPLKERLRELNLPQDSFIVSGDKPLTKSALYRRWEAFCKKKDIRIDRHSIRHQFATTLYDAGIDAKSAQDLLGHAQISTTMDIYTHISEEKRKKDFSTLTEFVQKNLQ